jgi:phage shock protein PspC (stress-responsive transcriptional regulator)
MNKTIIININGIIFHIEEDAYEILKNYVTDVKRHFMNSADSLEITTDIENRIAEMFSEILVKDNKQVIIEQDVQFVIEQMGRVEDFDNIYEDEPKSIAGGYTYGNTGERKLFRDPDNHLVGGVCSGIASYFGIEALWVRLAFVILAFFGATGVLLYIILWLVVPRATTRADRMAMNGQKINLQGFKNNLEEELSAVRGHLNNLHQEATPFVYKLRDFISEFFTHLGLFFNGAGKILIKILGLILLLAFFGIAIALVTVLIGVVGFDSGHMGNPFDFNIIESAYANKIYVSAFITAFIPVLTLILVTIAAIFNTRHIGRSAGTTLLVIWLCSLGVFIYYAAKVARNFRSSGEFSQVINLKPASGNVYYLKLNEAKYLSHDDSLRLNVAGNFVHMTIKDDGDDNDLEPRNVSINIERSDVSQAVLIENFRAQGFDEEDALLNARNTKYIFTQQDSVLKFDNKLRRLNDNIWHDENIELTLKLPLNAKVVIDQELNDKVDMNGISVRDCNGQDKHDNALSAAYIMTDDGLQCKIDTVVTTKTQAQIDSTRRVDSLRVVTRLQQQLDSARKAGSVKK